MRLWATLVSAVLMGQILVPPSVSDTPDPCEASVTKAGVDAQAADIERSAFGIYCLISFKTVGNDYVMTVPPSVSQIDYLVVGGGGGGASGGGGGGGVLQGFDHMVTAGSELDITVGAGGAGGNGGNREPVLAAKSGESSGIEVQGEPAILALGGGAGGSRFGGTLASQTGASGGGARFDCPSDPGNACNDGRWGPLGNAGLGTPGQGNPGAPATFAAFGAGGGGGGAGGPGGNTNKTHIAGDGGVGVPSSITGAELYFGGGGGGGINDNSNQYGFVEAGVYKRSASIVIEHRGAGGIGGLGGGGNGSSYGYTSGIQGVKANATAGLPNTGGGGGGTDPEDINGQPGGSGIVVLRWVGSQNLRTITFNSNSPSAQTSTQVVSADVTSTLDRNLFTRDGFIFSGWEVQRDLVGELDYQDAATISTSLDITLYAQWDEGVTATVTFDANRDSDPGTGSMSAQTAGQSLPLTKNTFTRDGYRFSGWNTQVDGTGFAYADEAIFAFQFDATMYAQWTQIVTEYTVTFFGNGADGGNTPGQRASSPTALRLNGFTRAGFNFLGWSTTFNDNNFQPDATSGLNDYRDGQSYSFASNLSLFAVWVAQANNTLVFDGNTADSGATPSQIASSSTLLNSNGFLKENHTFLGWNTRADGSGTSYDSGYVYSFATGLTLYAQWGEHYSVTYDANEASSGNAHAFQNSFVGSTGVDLALNSGNLVRTGFRLAGWNKLSTGLGSPYALGARGIRFTEDTTLYAQWAPATYKIIYVADNKTSGTEPSDQTFQFGTPVSIAENSGELERSGFSFVGWSTEPDASVATFEPAASDVNLSSDTVLFAAWLALPASDPAPGQEEPGFSEPAPNLPTGDFVQEVPSLDPGQEVTIAEGDQETIFLTGDFLNLITEVKLGGLLVLPFEAAANGEQITITIPPTRSGALKLTLSFGSLSLEQAITVSRTVEPGVVNAGTFNGIVAIYAKNFEGRRLSAKVGEDWVIVDALDARFVRIIERVRWYDYGLTVRIFIDRRLVRTVNLITASS